MHEQPSSQSVAAIASIGDPVRRSLYEFVAGAGAPVGRDEIAAALGLPRTTAAHHLDRLVESGVLTVGFQRLSGRTGPGAGRPAKLYRPAAAELSASVPERHYDLAAELLADAVEASDRTGEPIRQALARASIEQGRVLGEQAGSLDAVLTSTGYAPCADATGTLTLTNCPFHRLATRHTDTICHANVALLQGAAEGAGDDPARVVFQPAAGTCCVTIHAPTTTA